MKITDFSYEKDSFLYIENNVTYHIKVETKANSYELYITANKKGDRVQKRATHIAIFLHNHLYEHSRFRLEALTENKKDIFMEIQIEKHEYQYYKSEIMQTFFVLCLLLPGIIMDQKWVLYVYIPIQIIVSSNATNKRVPDYLETVEDIERHQKRLTKKIRFSFIMLIGIALVFIYSMIDLFIKM